MHFSKASNIIHIFYSFVNTFITFFIKKIWNKLPQTFLINFYAASFPSFSMLFSSISVSGSVPSVVPSLSSAGGSATSTL